MPRVPLTIGAYQAKSFIAAAQRSLNLYAEKNPQGEDSPTTLYLTPGLTRLGAPPQPDPVRGLYRATNGELFAAIGNGIYYIASNWTSALIGTTAVNTTPVKMGDNGTTMVIVDGSAFGWEVDLATHAYSAISDPNFFGSDFVETMDTYLIFNKPGTNVFYCSDSNSVVFDPLFFAAKAGYPDSLAGIAVQNRNIWLIGNQSTTEIWFDAGAADFPFQVMPGPFVEHGSIAKWSIAKQGGSIFWLSQDAYGTSVVIEAANFTANKISTPAIEYAIGTYAVITDAIGFCYEQQGHAFYWLKFPTENKDWVHDLSIKEWHERSWMNPGTCEQESHRANASAFAYGVNVVGDRETGQLYMLDLNNPIDAGDYIERRRGYPHMMADGSRASYSSFIADMQPGTAGTPLAAGLPPGLASTAVYPAVVTVIETAFQAPNGTLLQDYFLPYGIIETGAQFTQIDTGTDGEIESDMLTGAGTGIASYLVSGKSTSADYIAHFDAVPDSYDSAADAGFEVWVIGRGDASNNGYKLAVTSDGATYQIVLTVMPSTNTSVDMGTIPSGRFTVYLSMQGEAIDVAVQRSQDDKWLTSAAAWQVAFAKCISITDSTYTEAGNVLIGGTW